MDIAERVHQLTEFGIKYNVYPWDPENGAPALDASSGGAYELVTRYDNGLELIEPRTRYQKMRVSRTDLQAMLVREFGKKAGEALYKESGIDGVLMDPLEVASETHTIIDLGLKMKYIFQMPARTFNPQNPKSMYD
ncbi:hypothetical protein HZB02_03425 [Candidatus Woesearchaeota archaeon]|nr:hypothetical protein [Candidatus Woesearchaeota archaeon]